MRSDSVDMHYLAILLPISVPKRDKLLESKLIIIGNLTSLPSCTKLMWRLNEVEFYNHN